MLFYGYLISTEKDHLQNFNGSLYRIPNHINVGLEAMENRPLFDDDGFVEYNKLVSATCHRCKFSFILSYTIKSCVIEVLRTRKFILNYQ